MEIRAYKNNGEIIVHRTTAQLAPGDIAPARTTVERLPEKYIKQGEALHDTSDIRAMSDWYIERERYRDNMLLICGVNLGLRVVDLLSLRFAHFVNDDLTFRESFTITEKKTKKFNTKYINHAIVSAITLYLKNTKGIRLDDYMFRSDRSINEKWNSPLSTRMAENILKEAAVGVGLTQHVSTHTMRRTFAYHMWHNMGADEYALILVQKMLNHSSPQQTMTYIGITDAEIAKATLEVNLCDRVELLDTDIPTSPRETDLVTVATA